MVEVSAECGVWITKAAAADQQANYPEAIECYDRVIALAPHVGLAYFNRGMAYYMIGNYGLMRPDFERAVAIEPNNHAMLERIALVMVRMKDFIGAINILQRAIELKPDSEEAWLLLASAHSRLGNCEVARRMYDHLAQKFPDNKLVQLQRAYFLPAIPTSREEIDRVHEQFIRNLHELKKQGFRLDRPEIQARNFPFYHAYHAKNNVRIARELSEFFLSACPDLHFTAAHCKNPISRPKIRIGFVSEFIEKITLNQFWLSLIEQMAERGDFEVVIFSNSPTSIPAVAKQISGKPYRYVAFKNSLAETREQIAQAELDVLVYMEIGMAQQTYFLAHARLAPVQCVLSGHPVTSGISTLDYFISTRYFEPENAQEHYTETLVACEKPPLIFSRRPVPAILPERAALGLPEGANLYCCPVMLFKIHPDMDRIFSGILKRDPKAVIILFDSDYRTLWRASLEKRFAANMRAEECARIIFLPHANAEKFLQILSCVDAIIDPLHFSFGTTAYICLGANLPFVTMPGEFARGRGGFCLYTLMEMQELIAYTEEEYIALSVRLVNDKAFYVSMQEAIRTRGDVLFDDASATARLADVLKELAVLRITGDHEEMAEAG